MTLFSKFNFPKHSKTSGSDVLSKEKRVYYKRMSSRKKKDGLTFDLYIPKTRTVHTSLTFEMVKQEDTFDILQIDEAETRKNGSIVPNLEDGAGFLEADLVSQPCSIKDKKIRIYRDDLKNLCNITNQPLWNSKWKGSGTSIACPYCAGYYYINPSTPHANKCPYCFFTKAEAEEEMKRWDKPY